MRGVLRRLRPAATAGCRWRPRSTRSQYVAERVAGDHADVVNLTQPGAEPHDLELSPDADRRGRPTPTWSSTSTGLQPAVDAAVEQSATGETLDAGAVAGLEPIVHDGHDDAAHDHGRRGGEHGPRRPRPALLAGPAEAGEGRRRRRGRAGRGRPRPRRRLPGQRRGAGGATSRRWTRSTPHGLQGCAPRHGRGLPRRLRLPGPLRPHIEPIAGLSPDAEPTPADLARLQQLIEERRDHHRLLRAAGQPPAVAEPRRRHGDHDRSARPDRGAERRDGRRGLPFPDAREPRRPRARERMSVTLHAPRESRRSVSATARSPSAAARSCAASTSTVRSGEFVALMGANGSGKSTLVRALTGLRPLHRRVARAVRHRRSSDFHDWRPDRLRPPARRRGVRRTGLGLGGGRLGPAHPPPAVPAARRAPTAPRSTRRSTWSACADRARDGVSHPLRRPAAAGADRPGAGRRARAVLPRRAHRRRRPAQPVSAGRRRSARSRSAARRSCWSPTSSARWPPSSTARW